MRHGDLQRRSVRRVAQVNAALELLQELASVLFWFVICAGWIGWQSWRQWKAWNNHQRVRERELERILRNSSNWRSLWRK